ncbi:MAG: tetratricopeptide repeat protein [Blastochloris sp.]|nr:tetratricopeptide repeat protein [Blastochloris sp.]
MRKGLRKKTPLIQTPHRIVCCSLAWLLVFSTLTSSPQTLSAKPSSAETKALTLAQKAFQDAQYDVAAAKLEEFQKSFPKSELSHEVLILLGQSLLLQGSKDKALSLLQNTPDSLNARQKGDVLFWRAEAQRSLELWAKAQESYQSLARDFPDHPRLNEALRLHSEILLQLKRNDEARSVLEPLLALKTTDPQRHPAVLQLARIQVAEAKFSDAENLLELLLKEKLDRSIFISRHLPRRRSKPRTRPYGKSPRAFPQNHRGRKGLSPATRG